MARLIMLVMFMAMILTLGMAIRSCQATDTRRAKPFQTASDTSIIALRDGTTMVAASGTIGRDLVDWLAGNDPGPRGFAMGGNEFPAGSAIPTVESLGRIPRLVAMLKANGDVIVHIVGHAASSGDGRGDSTLGQARATALAEGLAEAGISRQRLSVEGETLPASDPAARDILLVLTRKK